jgi:hypothetical protein
MSSNELLTSPKGPDAAGARQQDPHQGMHSETGARPREQVRAAVAGFALTVTTLP